jgi:hypothetical protein
VGAYSAFQPLCSCKLDAHRPNFDASFKADFAGGTSLGCRLARSAVLTRFVPIQENSLRLIRVNKFALQRLRKAFRDLFGQCLDLRIDPKWFAFSRLDFDVSVIIPTLWIQMP